MQFHTGLGDADITLTRANPAHLQPLIEKYPRAKFVLLHASYPYTRDAAYLTAVYKNVYLDIGEVFPAVSKSGQEALIRQALELVPTNKLMWSSELFLVDEELLLYSCIGDGHWWPESYYLGSHQARQALSSVSTSCPYSRARVSREQGYARFCRKLSELMNLLEKKLRGSQRTSYSILRTGFTSLGWTRSVLR